VLNSRRTSQERSSSLGSRPEAGSQAGVAISGVDIPIVDESTASTTVLIKTEHFPSED